MNRLSSFINRPIFQRICATFVISITILFCTLPMGWSPLWNGEIPHHRDQYEKMAQALLEGRLFLEEADPELAKLANPYDPDERQASRISYRWDHSYYNGKYYMYFGIVPVLLLFLPYLLLTGSSLTTYHATQIFTAMAIWGFYCVFKLLSKLFFNKLPRIIFWCLFIALSVMSVWHSVAEPALYCTAVNAGIAFEIWSLYFFIRAVWDEKHENHQILLASVGSLLGALVFGCRPPIGLANLLVLPALVVFLKQRSFSVSLLCKLVLAALPYIFVGAALMIYNYLRFDNPFEFGQSYQLTIADMTNYGYPMNGTGFFKIFSAVSNSLLDPGTVSPGFPYLIPNGAFINFPILAFALCLLDSKSLSVINLYQFMPFLVCVMLSIILISVVHVLGSPYLYERYHMDIYFLAALPCFVGIGIYSEECSGRKRQWFHMLVFSFAILTIITSCLFWLNTFGSYHPEAIEAVKHMIRTLL